MRISTRGKASCFALALASITWSWLAILALWVPKAAAAVPPDKSGVKPSVISLPRGAGSIEGLGESFQPQLNTGGSTYGVSISVPPGRAGLVPSIRIAYNSFSGNGLAGIGWSLEFMSVKRQTDKGFPAYDSGDTYVFEGEELVPLTNAEHDWRCQNERNFQRLRQIDSDGDGVPDAWEVVERNGTRHTLGRFRGQNNRWSVVEHPEKATAGVVERTYEWLLDSTTDLHGNHIEYEYTQGTGVLYPSRISYSQLSNNVHEVLFQYEPRPDAFDDYRPTFSARLSFRLKRVEVRTQGQLVRAYNFVYNYEPGDLTTEEVALESNYLDLGVSLLKRVVQVDRSGNDANYLPPLVFTYSGLDLTKSEQRTLASPPNLDLAEPNGRVQLADLDGDGLPDLFSTTLEGATTVQRVALNRGESKLSGHPQLTFASAKQVIASSPVDLAAPNTVVHDPKGKGLVDMSNLTDDGGNKRLATFGNRAQLDVVDENRLGFSQDNFEQTVIANPPAFVTYSEAGTRQMDVNFDKKSDFVNLEPGFGGMLVHSFYIDRGGNWVPTQTTLPPSYPLANTFQDASGNPNPCVHLADMNGDRMLDLVCLAPTASGGGQRIHVSYWPLCGLGRYSDERPMAPADPDTFDIGNADLRDVFIEDFTGDGLADVLVLDGSGPETILTLRVNIAGQRWSPPYVMHGLPRYAPRDPSAPTVLRIADLNANGSLDLLFRNPAPSDSWSYVELLPSGAPNLMIGIDNGLGKRTSIVYGAAAEDEQVAREAGHPWKTFAPIALQVVRQIRATSGLDLNGDGKLDTLVSEFRYRDPYYDGFQHEFRGFAFAQRIDYGDDFLFDPVSSLMQVSPGWDRARTPTGQLSGPSLVTRYRFHTGASDQKDNDDYGGPPPPDAKIDEFSIPGGREEEGLKGLELVIEQVDPVLLHSAPDGDFDAGCEAAAKAGTPQGQAKLTPDTYVYTRVSKEWTLRRLYRPAEPIPYLADQNADGIPEDYRSTPAVPVPAGRFSSQSVFVLPGNGRSVTFALNSRQSTEIRDANGLLSSALGYAQAPPLTTSSTMEYDDYGNQTVLSELGLDDPAYDDERITTTTYAHGGNALTLWVIDKEDMVTVTDEAGTFVAKKVNFYDGDPFVGVQGQVQNRALLSRTLEYIDPNHFVQASRNRFDAFGNAVETQDPLGNFRRVTYDPVFQTHPIQETKVVGGGSPDLVMTAAYDYGFGVLTESADYNGHVTTYAYDSFARLVKAVQPGDSADLPTRAYEYEPCDPIRGRAFAYDSSGNLTLVAVPVGSASRVTTRQREISGQPGQFITATFSDGESRALANIEEGESPGTWVVKQASSYNLRGQPQSQWLPYRIASVEIPQFAVIWPSGRPPQSDGTNQIVATDRYYDPLGRQIRSVAPPETWGGERRVTLMQNLPLQVWTFDEEDTHAGSQHFGTPHIGYSDGLGRLVATAEITKLDDLGRPAAGTNAWMTKYVYDLNDQIVRITDSQNNVKTMQYDGLKRKTQVNDPDQGLTTYVYDDASNLIETTDAKGQRISYTYDGVNRIHTEDYHDENSSEFSYHRSPDVTYVYDQTTAVVDQGDGTIFTSRNTKGRLAYVLDASGEEHTSYDERGRVERIVKRVPDAGTDGPLLPLPSALISYATHFEYDAMDRVTRMQYPDNDEVSYVYNSRNLLDRIVGGPSGSIIAGIEYRPSGQQEQVQFGNGVRTTYQYDPRLRLVELRTDSPGAAPANQELIHFHYDFDGVSNLKAIQDLRSATALPAADPRRNSQNFTYDNLYRLVTAQYNAPAAASANGGTINYRYDRIGNLLAQSSDIVHLEQGRSVTDLGAMSYGGAAGPVNRSGRQPGNPPGPHALSSIQPVAGATRTFPYDANGNMTQIDGQHCIWDFKDRLVGVEDDTMRAEYLYDYSGRRIIKRVWPKLASGSPAPASGPLSSAVSYPSKDFEIRAHDQPAKYVFNNGTRVASITGSLSTNMRIQRLRLYAGWNLCSVAVGGATLPVAAGTALKWSASGRNWLPVSANTPVEAGAVLWLFAPTNAVLALTGTYSDPTNRPVTLGGSFQAGAGLEALPLPVENPDLAFWYHDPASQSWGFHSKAVPEFDPSFRQALAPGQAMFLSAGAPTELVGPETALRIRYYHQDHLGSSSVTTDAQGALVEEIAYYPFGIPRNEMQIRQVDEPYTFTQKERDLESGLYYFEARYLAGGLTRFISADPKLASPDTLPAEERRTMLSEPQRLNLYAYVLNNPLRFYDPTGLDNKSGDSKDESKNQSPSDEMAEGAGNLFMFGAERDAAEFTGEFVKHAYEGSPTSLKVINTLTAPVWLPVVIFGSMTGSIVKDVYHIGRGGVRGAIGAAESIINRFRTVDAEPPPPIDIRIDEETSTRSSTSVHDDAPPPPPKQTPARPQPCPRPRLSPAPNPPRAVPQESSVREPMERDRRVDY